MEYIANKTMYAATMFACKMIRNGDPAGLAIHKSANYYKVDEHELAQHVGRRNRK